MPEKQTKNMEQPTVERLCAVDTRAYEHLRAMGITPEAIHQLQVISGEYRYDNCPEKVQRIASAGAYADFAQRQVVLPNLVSLSDERKEGHCGEIAAKLYRRLLTDGWFDEANKLTTQQDPNGLMLFGASGYTPTHFPPQNKQRHSWIVLGMSSLPYESSVAIDASFRRIIPATDYTIANVLPLDSVTYPPNPAMACLAYFERPDKTGWFEWPRTATAPRDWVIGVTNDYKNVVCLSFFISQALGQMRAALWVNDGYRNTVENAVGCYKKDDGTIGWVGHSDLGESYKQEVLALLETLDTIPIIDDAGMARQLDAQRVTE